MLVNFWEIFKVRLATFATNVRRRFSSNLTIESAETKSVFCSTKQNKVHYFLIWSKFFVVEFWANFWEIFQVASANFATNAFRRISNNYYVKNFWHWKASFKAVNKANFVLDLFSLVDLKFWKIFEKFLKWDLQHWRQMYVGVFQVIITIEIAVTEKRLLQH